MSNLESAVKSFIDSMETIKRLTGAYGWYNDINGISFQMDSEAFNKLVKDAEFTIEPFSVNNSDMKSKFKFKVGEAKFFTLSTEDYTDADKK